MIRRVRNGQKGQILPLTAAVMTFVLLPFSILVIDGALFEAAYAQLGETLEASAEDGASAINQDVYRQSGGQQVVLDQVAAKATSERSLVASQMPGLDAWTVTVQANTVTVSGQVRVQLFVLGAVNLRETKSATFAYGS